MQLPQPIWCRSRAFIHLEILYFLPVDRYPGRDDGGRPPRDDRGHRSTRRDYDDDRYRRDARDDRYGGRYDDSRRSGGPRYEDDRRRPDDDHRPMPEDRRDDRRGRDRGRAGSSGFRDDAPTPDRRSPTPPGAAPLSKRPRKASGWDLHAPGYEQYTASQAKATGDSRRCYWDINILTVRIRFIQSPRSK